MKSLIEDKNVNTELAAILYEGRPWEVRVPVERTIAYLQAKLRQNCFNKVDKLKSVMANYATSVSIRTRRAYHYNKMWEYCKIGIEALFNTTEKLAKELEHTLVVSKKAGVSVKQVVGEFDKVVVAGDHIVRANAAVRDQVTELRFHRWITLSDWGFAQSPFYIGEVMEAPIFESSGSFDVGEAITCIIDQYNTDLYTQAEEYLEQYLESQCSYFHNLND